MHRIHGPFQKLCDYIGAQLSQAKTERPYTKLTFLSLQVDTVLQVVSILNGKLHEALDMITQQNKFKNYCKSHITVSWQATVHCKGNSCRQMVHQMFVQSNKNSFAKRKMPFW